MPEALTIHAFNHVALQTKRLEESIAFYRDVLGFRQISRPAFNFDGAWLYNAGIQIHLIVDERAADPGSSINSRADHFAFATHDVDEMERRLQALGVQYVRRLIQDRGIPQLFFHDPDGHVIEVGGPYSAIDR